MDQNIPGYIKFILPYRIIRKMYYLEGFKMYKTIIKSTERASFVAEDGFSELRIDYGGKYNMSMAIRKHIFKVISFDGGKPLR